ncbi:DMT family transporter [Gracilibacillus marinus]|uniref:DMT family transporter n=1 Tax=Gracilibacillus marinus TaxID=630535 RepID=A0ABV8VXW8_9BACI
MTIRAFLFASLTVSIWGSTFAAIRISLHGGYEPGHLVLMRYIIASLLFIVYALWPTTNFRLPYLKDILYLLLLSFIGISIYHIGVTFGEVSVSAGTAGMIIGSVPIFTTFFAMLFLKERISIYGWIGLIIGFIGLIIISLGSNSGAFHFNKGTIFIFISAIAAAFFTVFQKPLLKRYKPIEFTAYVTWIGTIPFFLFVDGITTISHATMDAHLATIYVGIFPAAIAYVTWAIALSYGNASTISTFLYVEPFIAVIVAWLLLKELPSLISIIGGCIVIVGLIIGQYKGKKNKRVRLPKAS